LNEEILKAIKDTDTIVDKKEGKNLIDLLQTPCSVFATFESEEGYNRAKKYSDQPQKHFCMQPLELQEASEPTDIIWENRQFTENTRNFKRVIVWSIIAIMLAISGALIFVMTNISLGLKFKYPKVDCSIFENEYMGSGGSGLDTWTNDAVMEYNANLNVTQTYFSGTMQCFCKHQNDLDVDKTTEYATTADPSDKIPIC